jgi:hypothetical protein
MSEREQLKDYLDLVEQEKFKFERDTGHHPDLLIIHPKSRAGLCRVVRLMQQYFNPYIPVDQCQHVESFMGMKIIESELFTEPTVGLITNEVKITDHFGDCYAYRILGKSVAIPVGAP